MVAGLVLLTGNLFAEKAEPALGGYCPVCYLAAGKAAKGTAEFTAQHEGETYYFVGQKAVDAFNENPEKFLPQYDGYCAYGMSLGKKFESDPTVFSVIDGKLYLNKSDKVAGLFAEGTASHISKADAQWKGFEMAMKEKEMSMKDEMKK